MAKSSSYDHDRKPNSSHPLMGADVGTLYRVFRNSGPLAKNSRHLMFAAFGSALGRFPLSTVESAITGVLRRRRSMPQPIFIVGHWRSGTTHLYNLLSQSGRFGFVYPVAAGLPWDFLLLGRILRPWLERALPENRFVDRIPVNPDSPQEDEIALASMQELSFYHGIYFPRQIKEHFNRGLFFDGCEEKEIERWRKRFILFMDKLGLAQPGKPLLIKNPVYTARVDMLHQMWPDARFIHIYRNPYSVFQSTRNFYVSLLREFALQDHNPEDIDDLILKSYPRMMNKLFSDAAQLPTGRFSEVRYEDLDCNPLVELERIYREIDLGEFEQDRPAFEAYVSGISGYRKNVFSYPEIDNARVYEHWQPFIDRWLYLPPEP